MRSFLIAAGTIAAMLCIVPLWIWGATGSWRHALHAGKQYWSIVAFLFAVGAVVGLAMALAPV